MDRFRIRNRESPKDIKLPHRLNSRLRSTTLKRLLKKIEDSVDLSSIDDDTLVNVFKESLLFLKSKEAS